MAWVVSTSALADPRAEFEARFGPLDGAWCALEPVPDRENAAVPIEAAAWLAIWGHWDDERLLGMSNVPAGSWDPRDRGVLARALARNSMALRTLEQARGKTRSDFGRPPLLIAPRRMGFAPGLGLVSSLVVLRGREAAREGRFDDALADLELAGTVADALRRESDVLCHLLAEWVERWRLVLASEILVGRRLDRCRLERLLRAVGEPDLLAGWRRALACDLAAAAADLRRLDWVHGVAQLDFDGTQWGWSDAWGMQSNHFVDWGRGATQNVARNLWIRLASGPVIDRMLTAGMAGIDLFRPEVSHPEVLAEIRRRSADWSVVPGSGLYDWRKVAGFHGSAAGLLGAQRLVRAGVEVRLRALETRAYPATLAGIVAAVDPDPLTGNDMTLEPGLNGSAVLLVPGAAEAWDAVVDAWLRPPDALRRTVWLPTSLILPAP